MKKILLSALLLTNFSLLLDAQKETDRWFFGVNAGIDFTSGSPVVMSNTMLNTPEASSSICDATGGLLFYTDGQNVWNRTHQLMPNGTGLLAGTSSTQGVLIVPMPGSSTLYYVFTTDEIGGGNGFRYSVVDMSLQSGLGDVTSTKNVLVKNNVVEKLTAVKHPSGNQYWIMIHEWGTDAFYTYPLTNTGLGAPVISNTGIIHSSSAIQNTYGQMKFSPCGTRVALAAGYLDTAEVFSFNISNGIVYNPVTIPMPDHVYGLEFSPSGEVLYVSCYDPSGTLLQYDLLSGVEATIIASKTVLSTTADIYAMQLARDGKIYVVKSYNQNLGVINFPNLTGTGANYVDTGFDLDPNFNGIMPGPGLPAFPTSFFTGEQVCDTGIGIEEKNDDEEIIYPNPSNSFFTIILHGSPAIISIYSYDGKLVENISATDSRIEFGNNYSAGVYFIRVEQGEKIQNYKIVRQ